MGDVAAWVVVASLEIAHEMGVARTELEKLFEGLSWSYREICHPLRSIGWDDYLVLLDRLTERVGGMETMDLIARVTFPRAFGVFDRLAGSLASARLFYKVGATRLRPQVFRCTRGEFREISNDRVEVTVRILDGYRDHPPFFHVQRGLLAGAPSILGLPNSQVTMNVRPRRAIYSIDLPNPITPPQDARDEEAELREFNRMCGRVEPLAIYRRLRGATQSAYAEEDVEEESSSFLREVVLAITRELDGGTPSIESVASSLGLSPRTLARRLDAQGMSYRELRDEARRRLAVKHLLEGVSIDEIAIRLGFSEGSSFHRAFKRWTGLTPSEYRRQA